MSANIKLCRATALIAGDNLAAVAQALTVPTRIVTERDGKVCVEAGPPLQHFRRDSEGMIVDRGLHSHVHAILADQGHEVTVSGIFGWPGLQVADKAWAARIGLPRAQRELAACVIEFPYGQIAYRRGADLRLFIATIVRLFPTLNILIVAPGRKDLAGLAGHLTKRTALRVHNKPRAAWRHSPRRLVTTRYHFPSVNADDWDVIVFTDPRILHSEDCRQRALSLGRQQLYCLRPDSARLTRHEELLVAGAVGPVIHTGPSNRGVEASVKVLLANSPLYAREDELRSGRGPLECKRQHYWHHDRRNVCIAEIAQAFSRCDVPCLWQHGLLLDREEQWLRTAFHGVPRVSIIVEAPEHGRVLRDMLPGWFSADKRPKATWRRIYATR